MCCFTTLLDGGGKKDLDTLAFSLVRRLSSRFQDGWFFTRLG